jgi:hypothetical protein
MDPPIIIARELSDSRAYLQSHSAVIKKNNNIVILVATCSRAPKSSGATRWLNGDEKDFGKIMGNETSD